MSYVPLCSSRRGTAIRVSSGVRGGQKKGQNGGEKGTTLRQVFLSKYRRFILLEAVFVVPSDRRNGNLLIRHRHVRRQSQRLVGAGLTDCSQLLAFAIEPDELVHGSTSKATGPKGQNACLGYEEARPVRLWIVGDIFGDAGRPPVSFMLSASNGWAIRVAPRRKRR